jgi:hypothetical protein
MIGHQAPRPDLRACCGAPLSQQGAIEPIIIITEECGLPAVATLSHMMRNVRNDNAGGTGHGHSPVDFVSKRQKSCKLKMGTVTVATVPVPRSGGVMGITRNC